MWPRNVSETKSEYRGVERRSITTHVKNRIEEDSSTQRKLFLERIGNHYDNASYLHQVLHDLGEFEESRPPILIRAVELAASYVVFEREAREYLFSSSLTRSTHEFEREVRE